MWGTEKFPVYLLGGDAQHEKSTLTASSSAIVIIPLLTNAKTEDQEHENDLPVGSCIGFLRGKISIYICSILKKILKRNMHSIPMEFVQAAL